MRCFCHVSTSPGEGFCFRRLEVGSSETRLTPNSWLYVKLSADSPGVTEQLREALRTVASQKFNLVGCHSVRLIKGINGIKSYRNATRALLVWWLQGKDNEFHHLEHSPQTPVSLRSVFPDDWSRIPVSYTHLTLPTKA